MPNDADARIHIPQAYDVGDVTMREAELVLAYYPLDGISEQLFGG
jgi:hypothetical protein